jgi:hypothetical protein
MIPAADENGLYVSGITVLDPSSINTLAVRW